MRAGDCAVFPAGKPNGHHLVNRSWGNALILAVGPNTSADRVTYPDIDLMYDDATDSYMHKDGAVSEARCVRTAAPAVAEPSALEKHTLEPRTYRHK